MVNRFILKSSVLLGFLIAGNYTSTLASNFGWVGKDSIGTKIINGEKFIQHKITKGETLYSLNRKYNIPIDIIKKNNPIKAEKLTVGETLLIPMPGNKTNAANDNTQKADDSVKKTEKANRGDIEVKNIPADKVIENMPAIPEPGPKPEYLPQSASMTNRLNGLGEPVWAVKLTGKIEVFTDSRIQQEPMYALHNEIPEGTLIKIINPVNEKFVIVKTLKPSNSQILKDEVFLYISPVAARYLDIKSDPEKMEMRFTLTSK